MGDVAEIVHSQALDTALKMELNILSQALVELMVLITAILHLTLPSSVEPLVSAFMIGNLFAIYVFPFAVIYGVSRCLGSLLNKSIPD